MFRLFSIGIFLKSFFFFFIKSFNFAASFSIFNWITNYSWLNQPYRTSQSSRIFSLFFSRMQKLRPRGKAPLAANQIERSTTRFWRLTISLFIYLFLFCLFFCLIRKSCIVFYSSFPTITNQSFFFTKKSYFVYIYLFIFMNYSCCLSFECNIKMRRYSEPKQNRDQHFGCFCQVGEEKTGGLRNKGGV